MNRPAHWRPMNPNYDPRDETTPRPQVTFSIRPAAELGRKLFEDFKQLQLRYHDMMLFDPTTSGTPGVVRFEFDTPPSVVDKAAAWLQSLPDIADVRPFYGPSSGAA